MESDFLGVAVRVALDKTVRGLAAACDGTGRLGEVNATGLATLTGHDPRSARRALLQGQPLRLLGLLEDRGGSDVAPSATVMRIARLDTVNSARLRTALVGRARKAELRWEDFAHLGDLADLAERSLASALASRTEGFNVLLYGSPGTGKTEFVRTLAERIGAHPMFLGEADDDDAEPSRTSRIAAFAIGRALAGRAGRALLVIDEADDIFTGVDDADANSRVGSKVFMNRLVERTTAPTIWISNQADRLGSAVLRRMSLAIRFPQPGQMVRRRIVERIAARRGMRLTQSDLGCLAAMSAAPAVMDSAIRLAKLTGGGLADVELAALSVSHAVNGAPVPPSISGGIPFDPALSEADHDLTALADQLSTSGELALSFCLHGPPGTGKSAYARYLAERLGLDVVEKRASDLLSKWLGDSEKRIALAFEEAADRRAMLIFDEADSFLRDRAGAHHAWEVSQVNEMLTWMERHPYPLTCTTNRMDSLDPATLRRFLFRDRVPPYETGSGARGVSARLQYGTPRQN